MVTLKIGKSVLPRTRNLQSRERRSDIRRKSSLEGAWRGLGLQRPQAGPHLMDASMAKSKITAQTYKAPTSGSVLGAVVKELRLQKASLMTKTAQRYFSGRRVKDDSKLEIIESLGEVLVDQDIFPSLPFLEREGLSLGKVLGFAIAWYAEQWDRLVGYMRSMSAAVDRPDLAATAYLRLVTIDLALRASAALWLAEIPTPNEVTPVWAEHRGGAKYLRQLLDQCGASAPTRDQLSERLEVSCNTVDSWLDAGARPSPGNIDRIAEELAPNIDGVDTETLKCQLHRHYALSGLLDLLSVHIGRDAVVDLVAALIRFTGRNLDGLRTFSKLPPEDAAKVQFFILLFGTRFVSSEHLLRALWRREGDAVWRTDLLAASKPWHLRLTHVTQHLGGLDQVVQLVHDEFGIPEEVAESLLDRVLRDVQADPTRLNIADPSELEGTTVVRIKGDAKYSARNRMIQYAQAKSEGDLDTAILHIKRAVELQPENAEYHFHLGATLGTAGEFTEGIQECWIAAQFDLSWELPKVEVGIILLNAGRNDEARNYLESIARNQSDLSAHLAFNLGVARFRCGEDKEALDALSRVVEIQPDHALALDVAAHCAFSLGNGKMGRHLAKRANALGYSETYRDWKEGKYRRGNGPP